MVTRVSIGARGRTCSTGQGFSVRARLHRQRPRTPAGTAAMADRARGASHTADRPTARATAASATEAVLVEESSNEFRLFLQIHLDGKVALACCGKGKYRYGLVVTGKARLLSNMAGRALGRPQHGPRRPRRSFAHGAGQAGEVGSGLDRGPGRDGGQLARGGPHLGPHLGPVPACHTSGSPTRRQGQAGHGPQAPPPTLEEGQGPDLGGDHHDPPPAVGRGGTAVPAFAAPVPGSGGGPRELLSSGVLVELVFAGCDRQGRRTSGGPARPPYGLWRGAGP